MGEVYKEDHSKNIFSHLYLVLREKSPVDTQKKRIIVIAGPTAVGKSHLAIKIAKILDGEIISADSMQVYKNMDIGTAKVSKEEQKEVPHHMIDICTIDQTFNVADFYHRAITICKDIVLRNKVPIIVGGSGFYIHALLYGPPQGPPAALEVREKLEKQLKEMGAEFLYEKLQMLDPEYAATISEKDKHKIVRALEIITITKMPVSHFKQENKVDSFFDFRCWFLYMEKEELYEKVEKRCSEMVKQGLIEEVKKLEKAGLRKNYTASQAIGYRQCLDFLEKKKKKKEFLEEFKKASKNYVKRQFTWFKKEPLFRWLNLSQVTEERAIEFILQDYEQGT